MRKLYVIILLLFCTMFTVGAQQRLRQQVVHGVTITRLEIVEQENRVNVSFMASVPARTVEKNETLVLLPVLTDGAYKVSLPLLVVEGKTSRRSRLRTAEAEEIWKFTNGEAIHYQASVEAQAWMNGGELRIETTRNSCCTTYENAEVVLAENLCLCERPEGGEVRTGEMRFVAETLADTLSVMFPFVVPEAIFDPEDPFKIYEEERKHSLVVYFNSSDAAIDKGYRDNAQTLTNLTAAIEMILKDAGSRVERVVVAGFSSPEGRFEFNDRLAFNRAVAVKHYLLQTTGLRDEQIWIYNGSVDWKGLRMLVEQSDMPEKSSIIDIIDNTPIWDSQRQIGRLGELMRFADGTPYRYMLREFFPLLRNGAFIKVYYRNSES